MRRRGEGSAGVPPCARDNPSACALLQQRCPILSLSARRLRRPCSSPRSSWGCSLSCCHHAPTLSSTRSRRSPPSVSSSWYPHGPVRTLPSCARPPRHSRPPSGCPRQGRSRLARHRAIRQCAACQCRTLRPRQSWHHYRGVVPGPVALRLPVQCSPHAASLPRRPSRDA